MKRVHNVSYQQILNNLMDVEHSLGAKSRIPKPFNLAILKSVGDYYGKLELKDSSEMVVGFIDILLEYFIGEKGLGRQEIVKALAPMIEAERHALSNSEKMTKNIRKL